MGNAQSLKVRPSFRDPFRRTPLVRGESARSVSSAIEDKALVYVIYTGGTIGMKKTENGYAPVKDWFPQFLRSLNNFHDKSVNCEPDWLVTPLSFVGRRIYYKFKEYDPLLDSSNMSMKEYIRIAKDIYDNYNKFDAFIILHGTDTMAYTASALSFMLENLGKPVILTGSQIPMIYGRNDGRENLFGALTVAAHYIIPEVLLFFDEKLFRGNRTTKSNAESYDAFAAPNSIPLLSFGVKIKVNWAAVFRSCETKKLSIFTNLDPNVGVLRLFPGITSGTVKQFLAPPMRGVVLETYGTGNMPDTRDDLIGLISDAVKRETLIVNCTQCSTGTVEALYATGSILERAGVVGGADMTVEAALAKLYYVLGKPWDLETKKRKMSLCLRGELTQFREPQLKFSDSTFISAISATLGTSSVEEVQIVKRVVNPVLACGAANNGDIEALSALKESGVNMSGADYDGRTPLHVASSNGDLPVVELLLSWGASVHVVDRFGNTPLIEAINNSNLEVAKLLIKTGAQIRLHNAQLAPILCNYAAEGRVDEILLYHLAGADVFAGDYDMRTPIHIAASLGQKAVLKQLLEIAKESKNPLEKINIKDVFSNPPLADALRSRHLKCVEMLVKAGAMLDDSEIEVSGRASEG